MTLELDTNKTLTYEPTEVIYKGRSYKAPVDLIVLQSMDYIYKLLKTGDWKN